MNATLSTAPILSSRRRRVAGRLGLCTALAAAALFTTFGSPASAQEAPERTLRLGHGINEEHPLGQGSVKFAEILGRLSNGRMKMKVFPATQLGSETQMISAVRSGVQEIVITSSAPVATMVKEYMLFDLPFLFQNEKEADAVLDGPVGQKLLDLAQDKGMVGLCYWENGFRQVTNSRRAVKGLDDLAGLKLRTMQNPVYLESFKALGANAIPMPFTELYTAMETKAIDAEENPIAIIHSNKFYEVQKHVSLTRHAYAPYVVLVSLKFWDKLQPTEREQLRKACFEARDFQRGLNRRLQTQMIEQLKGHGMTVTDIPAAEIDKMRARLQPVVDKYTQEIGAPLVAQAQREIAAVRGKP